jgi:hypothetical protein
MAGTERRQERRARCSIPCEFVAEGDSVAAEVRNVSAGGLGLVAEAPALEQGDPVTIVLRPPGGRPFEVAALVWHVRAMRRSSGGKPNRYYGLVLGDASPEFAQLVQKLTGRERRDECASPRPLESRREPVSGPAAPPPAPPPALLHFAIRIRQIGGPRTCRVIACGATKDEAVQAALAEVGEGWALLDVRPQP